MCAYRIGRVQQPWTNLEPPIRGGVHRKLQDAGVDDDEALLRSDADAEADAEADLNIQIEVDSATEDTAESSSLFSSPPFPLSSSSSSVGYEEDESGRRVPSTSAKSAKFPAPSAPFPTEKLSREAYTAALEQKEIADGIRNYPSLDPETQEAIRAEYKALHKLVQEQGHYKCRYSEYGKEMIRYTMLFCTFLYFVRIEWYMTSACFLGMFWVRNLSYLCAPAPPTLRRMSGGRSPDLGNNARMCLSSNKSCSLPMMLATAESQATSSSTRSSEPSSLTSATASRSAGGRARTTCTTW